MKRITKAILMSILVSLAVISVVFAQGEELTLDLSRDFGYEGFNRGIQGTFSIKANGPANLESVKFYLDDIFIEEDVASPFAIQFDTDNYKTGTHVFSAVATTTDGNKINSQTISAVFVSKKEGTTAALKLIVPILIVAFGAKAITALGVKSNVKKGIKIPAGTSRSYTFGGGICPKCKRPFGFQFANINLISGKLMPCPHCGKWSIVKRASINELYAAEQAEQDIENPLIPETSEEEKLRKGLDESKYQNL